MALVSIYFWIIRPGLSYFRLGENLSSEQAAQIIGSHFGHIRDKLTNTLQLKKLADQDHKNSLLILAGIDQKISELKPIPFTSAIRLNDNKKHLKYFLFPLTAILLIAALAPAIWKEGTTNLIQYDKLILPKAPFSFELLNKNLFYSQGEDVTINLKMAGNEIPQDIYVSDGTNSYKLEKESTTRFHHTFKNIQKNIELRFSAAGFTSEPYLIEVKARPSIVSATAFLIYPEYLNKSEEQVKNVGDLLIPEGTKVTWKINTENASEIDFILDGHYNRLKGSTDGFIYSTNLRKNTVYQIVPRNEHIQSKDAVRNEITIIKDANPEIIVEETPDSLSSKVLYFSGKITDDYGFSKLQLKYTVKADGKSIRTMIKLVPIKKTVTEQSFFLMWNVQDASVKPGEMLEYYFEVSDNDGVNGPKTVRSAIKTLEVASPKSITEKLDKGSALLQQKMNKAIKLAEAVEKESKKMAETLIDKKQLSFDDKKQIQQLLQKQKDLEEAVKEIKSINEKNTYEKEENDLLKQDLAEKQKQIDNLFNHVLDEKTKQLLEKLQQMMDDNNKNQTQNELSKMQIDNKSLKNELDRILELYKQLEFEQNLQRNIDRLDELAKKQNELANKTTTQDAKPASKDDNTQQLLKEQQKLSSEFEDIKKEIDKLDQKNQELERPNSFKKSDELNKSIEEKQKSGENKLSENNKKEAARQQKKAGEEMQNLAKEMKEMQQDSESMQNNLNAKDLRQLLENLLRTSFDQEKVIANLKNINSSDPLYTTNVQKQRTIKDNMKTISDSLFSLSKRVPQIETTVNEEIQQINFNLEKSLDNLAERNTSAALRNQQYTMTSINNLSLMLNEALEQLQNSQKNSKGGKGQKQNMQQLQQMQKQLNEGMQKAREQMQKDGNQGSVPKGKMSQEFSKMAQQQQMIREALQKINREENKDGKGKLGDLNKAIEDMKSTERDLVNKKIQQETLTRQRDLLTKLLDAEKAEREQDEDKRRESKAATDFPPSYKKLLEQFKKATQSESEWIQKLPPTLNEYYKNKISDYFKLLNLPK